MPTTFTLTAPATFQLYHDSCAGLVHGCWQAPVLDADLRGHYDELLEQAQRHGSCPFWLLDMRQRQWHMPSFGPWFGADFAAAVQAALGQPVFTAYVLSSRHQTAAESQRTQAIQRACVQYDMYPCFFTSEDTALDWLRHQQALH